MKKIVALFLLLFNLAISGVTPVHASRIEMMKDVPDKDDFDFGPTSFAFELNPGETTKKTLQITNRSGERQSYQVEVEDFEGTDNPDQSSQLKGDQAGKYGARDWLQLELKEFSLEHGERLYFDVTITAPRNADAGDHYTAVLVKSEPKDTEKKEAKDTQPNVSVTSRVGSLFLISIPGEVRQEGKLESFSTNRPWYKDNKISFDMLFRNTGTTTLSPSGTIEIKNSIGKITETIEVKEFRVLRDSVRLNTISWDDSSWRAGRYTATLKLDRGYENYYDTKTIAFWILPVRRIVLATLSLVLVMIVLLSVKDKFYIQVGKRKRRF